MRVTHNTMTASLVQYLTAQNEALYDRQRIIASQKRINKPSDDPIATGKILDYRQTLASIDQYQTNIQTGMTRLDVTEATLKMIDDLLQVVQAIGQSEAGDSQGGRISERAQGLCASLRVRRGQRQSARCGSTS